MQRILQWYEANSGQVINFNKSTITFSPNTVQQTRQIICKKLGVNEANLPGKYLGLPMYLGRNKNAEFGFLLERVEQKLQGWGN